MTTTLLFRDEKNKLSRTYLLLGFLPEEGLLTAEDLRSKNRTYLKRQNVSTLITLTPGRPVLVRHGDHLFLGGDGERYPAWQWAVEIQSQPEEA